jgi:hypothetical protein
MEEGAVGEDSYEEQEEIEEEQAINYDDEDDDIAEQEMEDMNEGREGSEEEESSDMFAGTPATHTPVNVSSPKSSSEKSADETGSYT